MVNNIIKRFLIVTIDIVLSSVLYAQTQYDYYDDSAVAGGADRAFNGILIIIVLILLGVILLFVIGGTMNIYYWINPKANPSYKRETVTKEREASVIHEKELTPVPEEPIENIEINETPSQLLTKKEIEAIIRPSKEDKENTKGDPTCEYGYPCYTADNRKFLSFNVGYGLDDPRRPNRILIVLEGTEAICSNAIRSDYLEKLMLPKSLLCIGDNAINCKSLKKIVLPESLQYIGDSAFYGCESLQELIIPQSLSHIGTFALSNTGIRNIVNNSPNFKVIGGCLYDEMQERLIRYFGTEIIIDIPNTVKDITGAFTGCNNLEKVTLSKELSIIGERTFMGCTHLKEIVIPNGVTEIGRCAFWGCKKLEKVVVPEGVKSIKEMCFEDCQNLRYIVLPSTIEQIGDEEFDDYEIFGRCISLSYIFIPIGTKNKFVSFFDEDLLIEGNPNDFFEKKNQVSHIFSDSDIDTTITEQEIREGWSDEDGVRYSADGKKLLYSTRKSGNTIYRSSVRQYKVKSGTIVICDNAFESGDLETIELPDTIVRIGNSAFSGCRNLRQINVPNKVKYFGERVFNGCSSLRHIEIPPSIQVIKKAMFCDCSSLKEFILPPATKEIHDYAFNGCNSLSHLIIPNSVEYIGNKAFGACDRLNEIVLPPSVKNIDGNPFTATILTGKHYPVICKSLSYVVEDGGLYNSEKSILIACLSNETSFNVIDGVKIIGEGAFSENSRLKSIKLPLSLLEIGNSAFWGCDFQRIKLPNSIRRIGNFAFGNCEQIAKMELPEKLEFLGKNAFWSCKRIPELILPKTLKRIEEETFGGCESLKSIIVENPDVIIDKKAFYLLDSLEKIEFYGCPSSMDDELFCWTKNLKEIIVPRGTKKKFCMLLPSNVDIIKIKNKNKIEEDVEVLSSEISELDKAESWKDECDVIYSKDGKKLLTCEYKETVDNPFEDEFGNKTVIHNHRIVDYNDFDAFMDRMENRFIYEIISGTEIICDKAFSRCENLAKITIPESVKSIGVRAFEDCKSLEEFIFPSAVKTIKEYCFIACRNLKSIQLPESLVSIEKCAFVGCENLREIELPNTIKSIAESAFMGCPLEKIILPVDLESLGEGAFEYTKLKEVCIPKKVKEIGRNAFANCRELKVVEFKCEDVQCNDMVFVNVINQNGDTNAMVLDAIYVPKGTKDTYISKFPEYEDVINERD